MVPETSPFACTLDEVGARARLAQARALTARLSHRERIDNRLVLEFVCDGYTTELVDEFVRDERRCCAFFDFDVRRGDNHVTVELSAPTGAGHMLDAAMASFAPELGDGDRLALQREHSINRGADDAAGCGC